MWEDNFQGLSNLTYKRPNITELQNGVSIVCNSSLKKWDAVYNGALFQQSKTIRVIWINPTNTLLNERGQTQVYILHDPIYVKSKTRYKFTNKSETFHFVPLEGGRWPGGCGHAQAVISRICSRIEVYQDAYSEFSAHICMSEFFKFREFDIQKMSCQLLF